MKTVKTPGTVEEYISSFPPEIQEKMITIRDVIRENAPDAVEKISYGMPAYVMNGMLLYFAAHKYHIGFYPLTSAIKIFKSELSGYNVSKGTIQFPFDKPLPLDLIKSIILFRVNENKEKQRLKRQG